jgi:hypothetical protein
LQKYPRLKNKTKSFLEEKNTIRNLLFFVNWAAPCAKKCARPPTTSLHEKKLGNVSLSAIDAQKKKKVEICFFCELGSAPGKNEQDLRLPVCMKKNIGQHLLTGDWGTKKKQLKMRYRPKGNLLFF